MSEKRELPISLFPVSNEARSEPFVSEVDLTGILPVGKTIKVFWSKGGDENGAFNRTVGDPENPADTQKRMVDSRKGSSGDITPQKGQQVIYRNITKDAAPYDSAIQFLFTWEEESE